MGRRKKFTRKALREAVGRYFDSISREVEITEKVDSGKRDGHGHVIYDTVKVKNKLGETATVTEYIVPPTLSGLCSFLKIDQSTWSRWCDADKFPEFKDIIEQTKEKMLTWREEQLLTRKDVKGLIFDLENNYGYRERRDVKVSGSIEDLLKSLEEGVQEF